MDLSIEESRLKLEMFCAYQERCVSEVKAKCVQLKISPDLQEKLMKHLKEAGFLDETRFAESYVSGKFRIKKWGKRKIYAGLRAKGVSSKLIIVALNVINQDLYQETLLSLASKKQKELSLKKDSLWEKKIKLTRFLLQRGYENDLVADAVEQVFK
jgi:regulatory protein